jgi:hypothetical protein
MPYATDEDVAAALFAALAKLKRHPPVTDPVTTSGPLVHVEHYGGEATAAGVDEGFRGKLPAALLAFESAVPTGGVDGAEVDTILHDVEIAQRIVWRVYVGVGDARGDKAGTLGFVGQPGVLKLARLVKEALTGLRIPGLFDRDVVRFVGQQPWAIRTGLHYVHIVRFSTRLYLPGADDPTPADTTPLDEMRGTHGPPGAPFDRDLIDTTA